MCTLQGVDIRLCLADQCKDARTGIAPSGAIEICLEEAFKSSWEPSRHRSTAWKELECCRNLASDQTGCSAFSSETLAQDTLHFLPGPRHILPGRRCCELLHLPTQECLTPAGLVRWLLTARYRVLLPCLLPQPTAVVSLLTRFVLQGFCSGPSSTRMVLARTQPQPSPLSKTGSGEIEE